LSWYVEQNSILVINSLEFETDGSRSNSSSPLAFLMRSLLALQT
jgi:hypothetical protein